MSAKIPNSNPWIQPNQVDHFSLDDFNPVVRDSLPQAKSFSEYGDTTLNIELTLRRNLDAFESGQLHSLRDLSSFYNSQELLDLSYQELNSYLSNLDKEDLKDVYGASSWDIQVVKDFLKINKLDITNEEEQIAERRTIKFKVSAKEFESIFTDDDLIYEEGSYINKNRDTTNTFLHAQGELSDQFSEALIGFKITPDSDTTTLDPKSDTTPTDAIPSNTNPPSSSFYPQTIASAYNYPELDGGEGIRIGLVGSGGNIAMQGLLDIPLYHQYLRKQGINRDVLNVQAIDKTEGNQGQDGINEQMLDISVLTSIAPNAQIIASNHDDYAELIYHQDRLDIISSSEYSTPLLSYLSPAKEQLYVDALLREITVVVAAGDQGSMNLLSNGFLWPFGEPLANASTSSAAVLSIGGTSFSPNFERDMVVDGSLHDSLTGLVDDQLMWNQISPVTWKQFPPSDGDQLYVDWDILTGNTIGSSGSWKSDDRVLNAGYQQDNLGHEIDGYARKYPDISVLAGGNFEHHTNDTYTIVTYDEFTKTYGFTSIGGTSAGTPLTAGLLALIAGDLKKHNPHAKIGFINPLLYEGYASNRRDDLFFDVPAGSNNANVFKVVDEASWHRKYYTIPKTLGDHPKFEVNADGGPHFVYLNGTGSGGSFDTSLSQTGYGFDDASGLGSLDGKELLSYLTEIHGSM